MQVLGNTCSIVTRSVTLVRTSTVTDPGKPTFEPKYFRVKTVYNSFLFSKFTQ